MNWSLAFAALAIHSGSWAQAAVSAAAPADYMFETAVPKFAIVVHTSAYDDRQLETDSIANAERDADRIAGVLRASEFDPIIVRNATKRDILARIDSLVARQLRHEHNKGLRPVLIIFFAGHGFSVEGEDYLTGRDFEKANNLGTGIAVSELVRRTSRLSDVLVFSDACRNKLAASPQSVGEPIDAEGQPDPPPDLPLLLASGTQRVGDEHEQRSLLSFAAHKGFAAKGFVNVEDENSPYSHALAEHLSRPDLPLRTALGRVRSNVVLATRGKQYPQVEDGGAAAAAFYLASSPRTHQLARDAWVQALSSQSAEEIGYFASEHASSRYAAAARRWLRDHASIGHETGRGER